MQLSKKISLLQLNANALTLNLDYTNSKWNPKDLKKTNVNQQLLFGWP